MKFTKCKPANNMVKFVAECVLTGFQDHLHTLLTNCLQWRYPPLLKTEEDHIKHQKQVIEYRQEYYANRQFILNDLTGAIAQIGWTLSIFIVQSNENDDGIGEGDVLTFIGLNIRDVMNTADAVAEGRIVIENELVDGEPTNSANSPEFININEMVNKFVTLYNDYKKG